MILINNSEDARELLSCSSGPYRAASFKTLDSQLFIVTPMNYIILPFIHQRVTRK